MEGLMTELADLSRRNDELMTAKDSDLVVIRDLDAQLKEYKRKYEQSKTELRSVKGELLAYSDDRSLIFPCSHFTAVLAATKDRRSASSFSGWWIAGHSRHGLRFRDRLASHGRAVKLSNASADADEVDRERRDGSRGGRARFRATAYARAC